MTTFVGFEKPSVEDAIEHYGVLGMKWGKHRAKATGSQIRTARLNVSAQKTAIKNQKNRVKQTGKGGEKLAKMQTDFLKNPDRVIAARMTRGEKAITMILFGPAAPVSIGVIAGTSAVSRRIERKQETGAYGRKK